jgi:DNA repair exonuclease SbcCD ATPase subunit
MMNNTYIKVYWDDTLDNYNITREREIKRYFEKKYNATVNVVFRAIRNLSTIEMNLPQADATDQVLDVNYQRTLAKKYMTDNNVTVQWEHFVKLDDNINTKIAASKELNTRYKKFYIKKITLDNFLSYADKEQTLDLGHMQGMSVIQSEPANKAGKTSGIVDALLFLFFGKTTKTETLEGAFNLYTKTDTVKVSGELEVDGELYLIERTVTRRLKRDKINYNIEGSLKFVQLNPDGTREDLKGERRQKTEKKITEYIGTYEDFLLTIITTIRNFYSLLESKPTERGKIFTRFIGVEILAEKAELCKKMQADWFRTSKLSQTNSEILDRQILEETEKLKGYQTMAASLDTEIKSDEALILSQDKDIEIERLKKHQNVDEELYKVQEADILSGIDRLNGLIKTKESGIDLLTKDLKQPVTTFDIDVYNSVKQELQDANNAHSEAKTKKSIADSMVQQLKSGEICPMCKRPLEGVDHSAEIQNQINLSAEHSAKMDETGTQISQLSGQLEQLDAVKEAWSTYEKAVLVIERNKLELEAFRTNLKQGEEKLTKYRNNKTFIEANRLIDTTIQRMKMQLQSAKDDRENKLLTLKGYQKDIEGTLLLIAKYNETKKDVSKDEQIQKIYLAYIDVFGKNGISKMILGTMIPVINSYLHQMMFDAVPFRLEIRLNDKNEVEFWMVDNEGGVEKKLMAGSGYESTISLLALRCVLSKVCSLPKPNIVVFDEVFGQVSNESMPLLGAFFERMKEYFDNIFIITHNPVMLEWADHVIHVKKIDNLTYISSNDIQKK